MKHLFLKNTNNGINYWYEDECTAQTIERNLDAYEL